MQEQRGFQGLGTKNATLKYDKTYTIPSFYNLCNRLCQ